MSSEAIRIESETLSALRERSAQSGEPIVRLAQRYIGEGMRLDRHPGIIFRDGPAGRRAVVIGGPDVWEVIAAARSASERGEELVRALGERIGVPVEKIRIAVSYYGEYPDEVDRFIAANEQEAEQLRARGRDVASVHDPEYQRLEGEPDEEVSAAALAANRVLVTENVQDFRRIETDALARAQPTARLMFTTDRQFPRGDPATIGRLVTALDALLIAEPDLATSLFLKPTLSP